MVSRIVKNELIRLFARKKLYIFMGIILIMTLIPILVTRYVGGENGIQMSGQTFPLQNQAAGVEMLLPIFLAILIADVFTEEYINGTFKIPLIQPVTRIKLLHAKIISLMISAGVLLMFTAAVSYLLGTAFLGWGGGFNVNDVLYSTSYGIQLTFFSYLSALIPLTAFALVIILIALILSSSGTVVGTAIGFIFGLNILGQLSEAVRPFLLSSYFNTGRLLVPVVESGEIVRAVLVVMAYGLSTYIANIYILKEKDIVY